MPCVRLLAQGRGAEDAAQGAVDKGRMWDVGLQLDRAVVQNNGNRVRAQVL